MTIKNGDMPAMPLPLGDETSAGSEGLSKREMFCLHSGVADTGDEDLDAIIRKGNRQKMAIHLAQGLLSGGFAVDNPSARFHELPYEAVSTADFILAELERTK